MTQQDIDEITQVINLYFTGSHEGDANKLEQAFHQQATISGVIDNKEYCDWSLPDFITRVTKKPTAAERKEKFDKKIIAIDQNDSIAMVKVRNVIGPIVFTDIITLLKINGKWMIRNKSFSGSFSA